MDELLINPLITKNRAAWSKPLEPAENMDQAAVLTLTLSSLAVADAKRSSCSV
jgi:hypothetical protein